MRQCSWWDGYVELIEKIEGAKREIDAYKMNDTTQERIKYFLKHLNRLADTKSPDLKRQYLLALVDKITVKHDGKNHIFTVVLKFPIDGHDNLVVTDEAVITDFSGWKKPPNVSFQSFSIHNIVYFWMLQNKQNFLNFQ